MSAFRRIRYYYLKTTKKIRDFLFSDKSREVLVFLFFFIIASGFWLLQTLNFDYETELAIPVRLKKIPSDVVLTSAPPEEVHVTVKDKGTVLLNYLLGTDFYPIELDFEDYKNQGNHVYIPIADLEKKIAAQLSQSTKLTVIKPEVVDYIFSKEKAKKIPVRLDGHVSAGRSYYISDTLCTPDSVIVFATQPILDTIKYAYTQSVDLSDVTDTLRTQVALAAIKGAKFVPAHVTFTFITDIYTEKTLEVALTGTGFPPGKVLRTFPSKVKVTFQIGLSRFKYIRPEDFVLTVPYEELVKSTTDKYRVRLNTSPEGVSNVRFSPAKVEKKKKKISVNGD